MYKNIKKKCNYKSMKRKILKHSYNNDNFYMMKINPDHENIIDNCFQNVAISHLDFYHKLNLIPNHLTTCSLFFGLLSGYLFYYDKTILSVISFIISYYFDTADGLYARKYKMETELGEIYDHIADTLRVLLILYIMYIKSSTKFYMYLPVIIIILFLSFVHLGCQEKHYNGQVKQHLISQTKMLCPNPKHIKYTKFCSSGLFTLIFIIIMLLYSK